MSLATRISDITSRFAANTSLDEGRISWDSLGAPHSQSGAAFRPPAIDSQDPESAIWQQVQVVPIPNTERPWGIGIDSPMFGRGLIVINTYFPRYSDVGVALEYAEEAAMIFHRQFFGVVRCQDKSSASFVRTDDWPNFQQIQISIPYYLHEVN